MPGREYFIPKTSEKFNPLTENREHFFFEIMEKPTTIRKAIYSSYTGISPLAAGEICYRASLDADASTSALSEDEKLHLSNNFFWYMEDVKKGFYTEYCDARQRAGGIFGIFVKTVCRFRDNFLRFHLTGA